MKNQYVYKSVVVLGVAVFLVLGGDSREVKAQSDSRENNKSPITSDAVAALPKIGLDLALVNEIKSIVKAKENLWIVEKEVEHTNSSGILWKLKKKQVIVYITEHETIEKAGERFAEVKSGRFISINVPIKEEKDFGDEAILRITNLYGGSTVNFYFRKGKYTVSVWGEQKDARRFSEHILAAINAR